MKLFRRKPQYATAMPVHRDATDKLGTAGLTIEWAVQPCDESGKPLSTHFDFVSEEQFKEIYEPFRVRPRPKAKPSRNGPKKTKPQAEKITDTVNLKDVK